MGFWSWPLPEKLPLQTQHRKRSENQFKIQIVVLSSIAILTPGPFNLLFQQTPPELQRIYECENTSANGHQREADTGLNPGRKYARGRGAEDIFNACRCCLVKHQGEKKGEAPNDAQPHRQRFDKVKSDNCDYREHTSHDSLEGSCDRHDTLVLVYNSVSRMFSFVSSLIGDGSVKSS